MTQSNDILEPRLAAIDLHALNVVDEFIQSYSTDCENIGYAIDALKEHLNNDPISKGLLATIQSAVFRVSIHAEETSEGIMDQLLSTPEMNKD